MSQGFLPLSVALPTYGKEHVLVDTVAQLLTQDPPAAEILVLDQSPTHEDSTTKALSDWDRSGRIRWLRFGPPSQPGALNVGLKESTQKIVLFLDDDIRIEQGFLAKHVVAFEHEDIWAVAGQVLQPGESEDLAYRHLPGAGPFADVDFRFRSSRRCFIENGMSGNLSVRKTRAVQIGGFDENFIPPVSFRFDNEFCKRLCRAGGKIVFSPEARIFHLRAEKGGTRSIGNHMSSASPIHGVGDYYFAFRQPAILSAMKYVARRPLREVSTRFHLKNPWYIPVKLIGEFRALFLAWRLSRKSPKLLNSRTSA